MSRLSRTRFAGKESGSVYRREQRLEVGGVDLELTSRDILAPYVDFGSKEFDS